MKTLLFRATNIAGILLVLVLIGLQPVHSLKAQSIDSLFQIATENPSLESRAEAYRLLSRSYRNINLDSSRLFINQALQLAKQSGNQDLLYQIETSAGALDWMNGDLLKARERFDAALQHFESRRDTANINRNLLNLGTVCQAKGLNPEAIDYFRRAYKIALKQRDTLIQAQSLGGISLAYFQLKEADSMNYYNDRARIVFEWKQDSANLGRNFINRGLFNDNLGRSYEARESFLRALEYLDGSPENALLGKGYQNLGNLEYRMANYEAAIGYLVKAKAYYDRLGWALQIGRVEIIIGQCFETWGREKTAREAYMRAYTIGDSAKDGSLQSSAVSNLASLYFKKKQYYQAINLYRQAISFLKDDYKNSNKFNHMVGIGKSYHELGRPDSAYKYLNKAFGEVNENRHYRSILFLELARVDLSVRDFAQAEAHLDSAEVWYQINRHPGGKREVFLLRSQRFEEMGDYVNALEARKQADILRDSLFTQTSTDQLMDLEAKYWSEKQKYALDLAQKNEALQAAEAESSRERAAKLAAQRNLLVIALALILLLGGMVYYYNDQRRKNQHRLRQSEMRMQTLRAQMNPHFIFNALGSVQLLINKKSVLEANLYLSKFARLLRKIMETSKKSTITVEDEKTGLELYIELEALRFKFKHEVEVSPDLESESISIPSMVVQPFVENAIKHGLPGLNEEGRLTVSFSEEGEDILCVVEDNGIGREAAALKPRNDDAHLSLSSRLVNERLSLMEPRKERLQIIDLKDDAGNPTGTRVEILLPIQ